MKTFLAGIFFSSLAYSQGVAMRVRGPVQPVRMDGRSVLVYELDVLNQSKAAINLQALEMTDASGRVLLSYDHATLLRNAIQVYPSRANLGPLKPGGRAMIFCWIELKTPAARVRNRLRYAGEGSPAVSEAAVEERPTLVIGPPVESGDWWIANGPSNNSEHRRAQVRKDGDPGAPFAQRYALDFGRICNGQWYANQGKNNSDYCGYNSKVLAVADAEVIASKDGIAENTPGLLAIKIDKENLMGNYVILNLGGGKQAVYAHLKPGSIRVKAGDRVRRGQEIGRVGNSGNSDAPHLHFHVSQEASVADLVIAQSDPVPYAIDHFENAGVYGKQGLQSVAPSARAAEIPAENMVVRLR